MLNNTEQLVNRLVDIMSGGVANLLMAVAFIAFLLSVINYIWTRRKGDSGGLKQAANMLFGATFGLFVMVAVWGIVNFISGNIFGAGGPATSVKRPQTNFRNTGSSGYPVNIPAGSDVRPSGDAGCGSGAGAC